MVGSERLMGTADGRGKTESFFSRQVIVSSLTLSGAILFFPNLDGYLPPGGQTKGLPYPVASYTSIKFSKLKASKSNNL